MKGSLLPPHSGVRPVPHRRSGWPGTRVSEALVLPGLVSLSLSLLLGACSGADGSPGGGPLPTLILADAPEVTIGEHKGGAPYLLSGVSDATVQSDGGIVILDCLSAELRYFDSSGRFLRAIGGRGEGPGEFSIPRRIFRLGGETVLASSTDLPE